MVKATKNPPIFRWAGYGLRVVDRMLWPGRDHMKLQRKAIPYLLRLPKDFAINRIFFAKGGEPNCEHGLDSKKEYAPRMMRGARLVAS